MIDIEIVREFLKQGAGFLLALVIWWYSRRDALNTEKKLGDILRDRKGDRDKLLELMSKVESHLARDDIFKEVVKQVIKESNKETPKRRALDRKLQQLAESDDLGFGEEVEFTHLMENQDANEK